MNMIVHIQRSIFMSITAAREYFNEMVASGHCLHSAATAPFTGEVLQISAVVTRDFAQFGAENAVLKTDNLR